MVFWDLDARAVDTQGFSIFNDLQKGSLAKALLSFDRSETFFNKLSILEILSGTCHRFFSFCGKRFNDSSFLWRRGRLSAAVYVARFCYTHCLRTTQCHAMVQFSSCGLVRLRATKNSQAHRWRHPTVACAASTDPGEPPKGRYHV